MGQIQDHPLRTVVVGLRVKAGGDDSATGGEGVLRTGEVGAWQPPRQKHRYPYLHCLDDHWTNLGEEKNEIMFNDLT